MFCDAIPMKNCEKRSTRLPMGGGTLCNFWRGERTREPACQQPRPTKLYLSVILIDRCALSIYKPPVVLGSVINLLRTFYHVLGMRAFGDSRFAAPRSQLRREVLGSIGCC